MSTPIALVLGGKGLLGRALLHQLQHAGWDTHSLSHEDCNLLSSNELQERIRFIAPEVIFNAAAWTQIDTAEQYPEKAMAVNRELPRLLGGIVSGTTIRLFHYSTASVFDGQTQRPYTEEDAPGPLSVYAKSKLAGEEALLARQEHNTCIIRTSWLFGPGSGSLVNRDLQLALKCSRLPVAHDLIGSPTYTPDLAKASLHLLEKEATGIFHVANAGQASWCELLAEAVRLANVPCSIQATGSTLSPDAAPRPRYTALNCTKYTSTTGAVLRPWPQALRDYIFSMLLEHPSPEKN